MSFPRINLNDRWRRHARCVDSDPRSMVRFNPSGYNCLKAGANAKSLPLYVWLHGRGDKNTALHFICDRLDKDAPISPEGEILLHPFGHQCIGFKSAGAPDVMV